MKTIKKILLVEDDSFSAEVLEKALFPLEVEIKHLSNGTHVLKTIEEYNPDAIILDIMVIGKSGLEIIEELSNINHQILQKTVVMTSMEDQIIIPQVLEKGVHFFVKKSENSPSQIVEIVRNLLK
jgi:DNA-binding NarL/FixJ family response regulator